MNKATRTAIRKLKDNEGRYILNPDATAKWGYTLFGKPVYTTDSVSAIASEKTAIPPVTSRPTERHRTP